MDVVYLDGDVDLGHDATARQPDVAGRPGQLHDVQQLESVVAVLLFRGVCERLQSLETAQEAGHVLLTNDRSSVVAHVYTSYNKGLTTFRNKCVCTRNITILQWTPLNRISRLIESNILSGTKSIHIPAVLICAA